MSVQFTTGMALPLLKHRAYPKATSGTPDTPVALSVDAVAATSLTRSGTTATFTATAAHRLADGQMVAISGVTGANGLLYNGNFKITVTSATVFTYTMSGTPTGTAAGSPVVSYTPHAQWALLVADAANSVNIAFGPDLNADYDEILPGQTYTIPIPSGAKYDLSTFYVQASVASQVLRVLFS